MINQVILYRQVPSCMTSRPPAGEWRQCAALSWRKYRNAAEHDRLIPNGGIEGVTCSSKMYVILVVPVRSGFSGHSTRRFGYCQRSKIF